MIYVLFDPHAPHVTPAYDFAGAEGRIEWPMADGANLGPAGAWNFFWRLGFQPRRTTGEEKALPRDAIVVAATSAAPSPPVAEALLRWRRDGNWVLAAGTAAAHGDDLPPGAESLRSPYPEAALAYVLEDGIELVAPPGWSLTHWPGAAPAGRGLVAAMGGERHSPSRAVARRFDNAPALVASDRFVFLNASPFAAFQSWLQGQNDLGPWLAWRPRLFWLDEHVAALWRIVAAAMKPLASLPRIGVPTLGATTIVLRHDVDSSRDASYLDLEDRTGVAASHAVLLDRNRRFWVERLARSPRAECAFHYNTISRANLVAGELRQRLTRWRRGSRPMAAEYRPAVREIAGAGLRRQVERARARGIAVATLHRHGPFLLYPEWIDALEHCLGAVPEVQGSGSLFRASVLRWGARQIDGSFGTVTESPDPGYPLWWPFKLAHAGRSGAMLRGWESTSVMEPEPELVRQMLDHRIAELPQRLITLNYHPFHARRASFRPDGTMAWFTDVLECLVERRIEILTLRELYGRIDAQLADGPTHG
jgi:hypothetical protein